MPPSGLPGEGGRGPIVVLPSTSIFPLSVSSNGRYLVDKTGAPFLLQGDAAWSMEVVLNRTDVVTYLNDRQARGFNAVIMEAVEAHFYPSAQTNSANYNGDLPFSTPHDFSTYNSAYFDHVEYIVQQALARNITVWLFPLYFGFAAGAEGWYQYFSANGTTKIQNFCAYLAGRLKTYPNVIWVIGGDYTPSVSTYINAMYAGIVSQDTANLVLTAYGEDNDSTAVAGVTVPLAANWGYSYASIVWDVIRGIYAETPAVPALMGEAGYENEHGDSSQLLRAQAYQSVLAGGFGHVFGNDPVWFFGVLGDGNPGHTFADSDSASWTSRLNTAGANGMKYFGALFRTRIWHKLTADASNVFVTAGKGSGTTYVAAAYDATNGLLGIAYLQTTSGITVNTSLLACNTGTSITAKWYDPTNGTFSTIATYTTGGSRSFTPTGTNSAGDSDWVLVFE